jgi:uncharacterized protein YeaO (DUF488 family)
MPHCLLLMYFIVGIEPIHDWHAVFILAVVTLSNVISITIGGLGVREGLAAALSPSVGLGARGRRGGVLSVVLLDQADPRYHRARVDRREYEAPFAFDSRQRGLDACERHARKPRSMGMSIKAANVKLKRAYERPADDDGVRILVDRLWPRGVRKADAAIDRWVKEVAPSTALRKWFGHDPARWEGFRQRYVEELRVHPEELERLRALARKGTITLVYSAHDELHNDAVVLRQRLLGR